MRRKDESLSWLIVFLFVGALVAVASNRPKPVRLFYYQPIGSPVKVEGKQL